MGSPGKSPLSHHRETAISLDPRQACSRKTDSDAIRLEPGQYSIHTADHLPTPYLPDPLAATLAFRGLPGVTQKGPLEHDGASRELTARVELIPDSNDHVLLIPLRGEWPDIHGIRLEIAEHPDEMNQGFLRPSFPTQDIPPKWDRQGRLLRVYLRKGETAEVQYSCAVSSNRLEHLGDSRLGDAGRQNDVGMLAQLGSHWMVTPDRTLTLVHAVQQPICDPEFEKLHVARSRGESCVHLTTVSNQEETLVRFHRRSTAQLEVNAEWYEWIDDPDRPWPVRKKFSAVLAPASFPPRPSAVPTR